MLSYIAPLIVKTTRWRCFSRKSRAREVIMISQLDHQHRYIDLNVPHSANVKPSWFGEWVGHYEGDTLVVDTIGVDEKTVIDNYVTPHAGKLHAVRRRPVPLLRLAELLHPDRAVGLAAERRLGPRTWLRSRFESRQ
jgi:hypothetical protein